MQHQREPQAPTPMMSPGASAAAAGSPVGVPAAPCPPAGDCPPAVSYAMPGGGFIAPPVRMPAASACPAALCASCPCAGRSAGLRLASP